MISDERSFLKSLRSNLVADQHGQKILLSGFLIALVFGLMFRSITNPVNVRTYLEKNVKSSNPGLHFQFSQAQINLKDGFLPKFQLKINDLKVVSEDPCIMKPEIFINELRFPISIFALIRGRPPFDALEVESINIFTSEKYVECPKVKGDASVSEPESVRSIAQEPAKPWSSELVIKDIQIQNLEVFHSLYMDYPLEFSNIQISKKEDMDHRIYYELLAKSQLFRDQSLGSYLSSGNLFLKYVEKPSSLLDVHFYGNLREGYYSFIASCHLPEENCKIESHFKEIPLKSLDVFMNQSLFLSKPLNFKQLWLSLNMNSKIDLKKINDAIVDLSDISLEGELGRLFIEKFQVEKIKPFLWKPFILNVRDFDLKKALMVFNEDSWKNHFEDLGKLNGVVQVQDLNQLKVVGQLSGLSAIFSNKGNRKFQNVVNTNLQLNYNYPLWTFDLDHILLEDGFLQGKIQLNGDLENQSFKVNADIQEFRLSKGVQELMTHNGHISPSYLKLNMDYQKNRVTKFNSRFQVTEVVAEELDIKKLDLTVTGNSDLFDIQLGADEMILPAKSLAINFLSPLALVLQSKEMKLKNLKGELQLKSTQELFWNRLMAVDGSDVNGGKGTVLKSQGHWDSLGQIEGQIQVLPKKGSAVKWRILGTRNDPKLVTFGK